MTTSAKTNQLAVWSRSFLDKRNPRHHTEFGSSLFHQVLPSDLGMTLMYSNMIIWFYLTSFQNEGLTFGAGSASEKMEKQSESAVATRVCLNCILIPGWRLMWSKCMSSFQPEFNEEEIMNMSNEQLLSIWHGLANYSNFIESLQGASQFMSPNSCRVPYEPQNLLTYLEKFFQRFWTMCCVVHVELFWSQTIR